MNLGSAIEISIADLTETIASVMGLEGEIDWGREQAQRPATPQTDTIRAESILDSSLQSHLKRDYGRQLSGISSKAGKMNE